VSFRKRLGLFFVLIVIVPMVAVAILLFALVAKSEHAVGSADIAARQQLARNVFNDMSRASQAPVKIVTHDDVLLQALLKGDTARARRRARQLLASRRMKRLAFIKDGLVVFEVGEKTAIAPASPKLYVRTSPRGERPVRKEQVGVLQVSVVDARSYAEELRRIAGLEAVVRNGGKLLATTLPDADLRALPAKTRGLRAVTINGRRYRLDAFDGPGFPGQHVTVLTLGVPAKATATAHDRARKGRIEMGGILLGFLLLALACAVQVSREMQLQLAGFLEAARRLAAGDFSTQVKTVGEDEFANLGQEFNKMSRELERRIAELGQERERVQDSMRRLGEAIASKLDRDALLEIVVRTAVDGVAADAGRAYVRGTDLVHENLQERASVGSMSGLDAVVQSVEADALQFGNPRETSFGEAHAMAHPLRSTDIASIAAGVVSVGRSGKAFTQSERELFHYLAGQAARSMESVDQHETVTRESVTDELTGLSNRRAFDDALASEVERAKRFGGMLGLVLIDLDDFKTINDTHGHPQGDVVLREVARVLRESSREIDHPARYGGEELALVLPGTDIEGAFNLAERVREQIERLHIPRIDGAGSLHVTASCGVAAVPQTPADEGALVAAADQALYAAKRGGKNKSVRAR
jgi:diguanylate cyclase (GGDEF)-like protein